MALNDRDVKHDKKLRELTSEVSELKAANARKDEEVALMKSYLCNKDPIAPIYTSKSLKSRLPAKIK